MLMAAFKHSSGVRVNVLCPHDYSPSPHHCRPPPPTKDVEYSIRVVSDAARCSRVFAELLAQ